MSLLTETTSRLEAEVQRFLLRQKSSVQTAATASTSSSGHTRERQAVGEFLADVRRAAVAVYSTGQRTASPLPQGATAAATATAAQLAKSNGLLPALTTTTAASVQRSAPRETLSTTLPSIPHTHKTNTTGSKARAGRGRPDSSPSPARKGITAGGTDTKEESGLRALVAGRRAHCPGTSNNKNNSGIGSTAAAATVIAAAPGRKPSDRSASKQHTTKRTSTKAAPIAPPPPPPSSAPPIAARTYFTRLCAAQAAAALERGLITEAAELFLAPCAEDIEALRPFAALLVHAYAPGATSPSPTSSEPLTSAGHVAAPPVWGGKPTVNKYGTTLADENGKDHPHGSGSTRAVAPALNARGARGNREEEHLPLVVQAYLRVWQHDVLSALCESYTVLAGDPFFDAAEETMAALRSRMWDRVVGAMRNMVALAGLPLPTDTRDLPEEVLHRAERLLRSNPLSPTTTAVEDLFFSSIAEAVSLPDVGYHLLYSAMVFLSDVVKAVTQRAVAVEDAAAMVRATAVAGPDVRLTAPLYSLATQTLAACLDLCEANDKVPLDHLFTELATVKFLPFRLGLYEQLVSYCVAAARATRGVAETEKEAMLRCVREAQRVAARASLHVKDLVTLEFSDEVPPPPAWQELLRDAQQRVALQELRLQWLSQACSGAGTRGAATTTAAAAVSGDADAPPLAKGQVLPEGEAASAFPANGAAMLDAVWHCVVAGDALPVGDAFDPSAVTSSPQSSSFRQGAHAAKATAAAQVSGSKGSASRAGGRSRSTRDKDIINKAAAQTAASETAAAAEAAKTAEVARKAATARRVRQFLRLGRPFLQSFLTTAVQRLGEEATPSRTAVVGSSGDVTGSGGGPSASPVLSPRSPAATANRKATGVGGQQMAHPQMREHTAARSLFHMAQGALEILVELATEKDWVARKESMLARPRARELFPFDVEAVMADESRRAAKARAAQREAAAAAGSASTSSTPRPGAPVESSEKPSPRTTAQAAKKAAGGGRSPRTNATATRDGNEKGDGPSPATITGSGQQQAGDAPAASSSNAANGPTVSRSSYATALEALDVREHLTLAELFPTLFSVPGSPTVSGKESETETADTRTHGRAATREAGLLVDALPLEEILYGEIMGLVSLAQGLFPSTHSMAALEGSTHATTLYVRQCAVLMDALDGKAKDLKQKSEASDGQPILAAHKVVLRWLALARSTLGMLQRLRYAQASLSSPSTTTTLLPAKVLDLTEALTVTQGSSQVTANTPKEPSIVLLLPTCEALQRVLGQLREILVGAAPCTRALGPLTAFYANLLARVANDLLQHAVALRQRRQAAQRRREELGLDALDTEGSDVEEETPHGTEAKTGSHTEDAALLASAFTPHAPPTPQQTEEEEEEEEAFFSLIGLVVEAFAATHGAGIDALDTLSFGELTRELAEGTLARIRAALGGEHRGIGRGGVGEQHSHGGAVCDEETETSAGPSQETLEKLRSSAQRAVALAEVGLAGVQQRQQSLYRFTTSATTRGDDYDATTALVLLLQDCRTTLTRSAVELRWFTALLQTRLRAYRKRQADVRTLTLRHARAAVFGAATMKETRILNTLLHEDPEVPEAPAALEARLLSHTLHEHPLLRALVLLCVAGLQSARQVAQEHFLTAMDVLSRYQKSKRADAADAATGKSPATRPHRGHASTAGDVDGAYSPMLVWSMAVSLGCRVATNGGGDASAADAMSHVNFAAAALYERFVLPDPSSPSATGKDQRNGGGHTANGTSQHHHKDPEALVAFTERFVGSDRAMSPTASLALTPNTVALSTSSQAIHAALCEALLDLSSAQLQAVTAASAGKTMAPAARQTTALRCAYRALFALEIATGDHNRGTASATSDEDAPESNMAVSPLMLRCAHQVYAGLLPCLEDPHYSPHILEPLVSLCVVLVHTRGDVWFDAGLQFLAIRILASLHEALLRADNTFSSSPSASSAATWSARLQDLRFLLLRTFAHVWNAVYAFPCQRQARYLAAIRTANTMAQQAAQSAGVVKKQLARDGAATTATGGGPSTSSPAPLATGTETGNASDADDGKTRTSPPTPAAVTFSGSDYAPHPSSDTLLMEDAMPIEYVELLEQLLFTVPDALAVLAASAPLRTSPRGHSDAATSKRTPSLPARPKSQDRLSTHNSLHNNGAPSPRPSTGTGSQADTAALLGIRQVLTREGPITGLPRLLHEVASVLTAAPQQPSASGADPAEPPALQRNFQEALLRHRTHPSFAKTAMHCVEWLMARRAYPAARGLAAFALDVVKENWQEVRTYQTEVLDNLRAWLVKDGYVLTTKSARASLAPAGGLGPSPSGHAVGDNGRDETEGEEEGGEASGQHGGASRSRAPHPPSRAAVDKQKPQGGAAAGGRTKLSKKQQKEEEAALTAAAQAAAEAADRARFLVVKRAWTAPEQQMLRQLTRAMAWVRQRRAASHVRNRFFQFNGVFQAQLRVQLASLLRLEWVWLAEQQQKQPGAVLSNASLMAAVDPTASSAAAAAAASGGSSSNRKAPSSSRAKQQQLLQQQQKQQCVFDAVTDGAAVHAAVARHAVKASHLFTRAFRPAHALRAVQLVAGDIHTYVAGGTDAALPLAHIFFATAQADGESARNTARFSSTDAAATAYATARQHLSPAVLRQLQASCPSLLPLATELLAIMASITRGYCDHRRDMEVLQPAAIRTGRFLCRGQQVAWQGYVPSLHARHNPTGQLEERRAVARAKHDRIRAIRQSRYWLQETMQEEAMTRTLVQRAFYADLRELLIREGMSAVFPEALDALPSSAQVEAMARGANEEEAEAMGSGGATDTRMLSVAIASSVVAGKTRRSGRAASGGPSHRRPGQSVGAEREKLHYFLYLEPLVNDALQRGNDGDRHNRGGDDDDDDDDGDRVEFAVRARQYGADMPEARVMDALLMLAHALQFTLPQETIQICRIAHTLTDGRYDAALLPLALSLEAALTGQCSPGLSQAYTAALRDASLGKTLLGNARGLWTRYTMTSSFARAEAHLTKTLLPSQGLPILAGLLPQQQQLTETTLSDGMNPLYPAMNGEGSSLSTEEGDEAGSDAHRERLDRQPAPHAGLKKVSAHSVLSAYHAAAARLREHRQFALLGECLLEMGFLALLLRQPLLECERYWREAVEALVELPQCWVRWREQLSGATTQTHRTETTPLAFSATRIGLPRILLAVHALASLGMYVYREKQSRAVDSYLFAERLLEAYLLPSHEDAEASGVSYGLPRTVHGYTDFVLRNLPGLSNGGSPNQLADGLARVMGSLVNSLVFLTHELVAYEYPVNACLTGAVAEHLATRYVKLTPVVVEARMQRARAAAAAGDFTAAMQFLRGVCQGTNLPAAPLHLILSDTTTLSVGLSGSLAHALGATTTNSNDDARKKPHGRGTAAADTTADHTTTAAAGGEPSATGEAPFLPTAAVPNAMSAGALTSTASPCVARLYHNEEPPTSPANVAAVTTLLAQCFPTAATTLATVLAAAVTHAPQQPQQPLASPTKADDAGHAPPSVAGVSPSQFLSRPVCQAYGTLLARRLILTVAEVLAQLATREAAYLWPQLYVADTPDTLVAAAAAAASGASGGPGHKRPGSGGSAASGGRRRTSAASAAAASASNAAATATAAARDSATNSTDRSACVEAYKAAEYLLGLFVAAGDDVISAISGGVSGGDSAAGTHAGNQQSSRKPVAGRTTASASGNRKKSAKTSSVYGADATRATTAAITEDEEAFGSGPSANGRRLAALYETAALSHHARLLLATTATELGHCDAALELLSVHLRHLRNATGSETAAAAATTTSSSSSTVATVAEKSLALLLHGFGVCPIPDIPSYLVTIDATHWRRALLLIAVNYFRLRAFDKLAVITTQAVSFCARTQDAYGLRAFLLYQAAGQLQTGHTGEAIHTLQSLRESTSQALAKNNPADDLDAVATLALYELERSASGAQALLLSAMSAMQAHALFTGALQTVPSGRFRWHAPALVKLHMAVNAHCEGRLAAVCGRASPDVRAVEELAQTATLLSRLLSAVTASYDASEAHPSFLLQSKLLLARAMIAAYTHAPAAAPAWCSSLAIPPPITKATSPNHTPLLRALPSSRTSPARAIAVLLMQVVEGAVLDGTHDYTLLRAALLELSTLLTDTMKRQQQQQARSIVVATDPTHTKTSSGSHDAITQAQYRHLSSVASTTAILATLMQRMSSQVFNGTDAFYDYTSDETMTMDIAAMPARFPQPVLAAIKATLRGDDRDGGETVGSSADLQSCFTAPISAFYMEMLETAAAAATGTGATSGRRGPGGSPASRGGLANAASTARAGGAGADYATRLALAQGAAPGSNAHASGGVSVPVSVLDMVSVFANYHRAWSGVVAVAPPKELLDHECALKLLKRYLQARTTPVSCTYLCYPADTRRAVTKALNPQRAPVVAGASSRKAAGGGGASAAAVALQQQAQQQQQETLDLWSALVPPILLPSLPTGLFTSCHGPGRLGAPSINAVVVATFVSSSLDFATPRGGSSSSTGAGTHRRKAHPPPPHRATMLDRWLDNGEGQLTTLSLAISPWNDPKLTHAPAIATAADRKRLLRQPHELPTRNSVPSAIDATSTTHGSSSTTQRPGPAGAGGGGAGSHASAGARPSSSGSNMALRFRNRLATMSAVQDQPDGTRPRRVRIDAALHERLQELEQEGPGSQRRPWLVFDGAKEYSADDLSDEDAHVSGSASEAGEDAERADADAPLPHWRCVPVQLPTQLVAELRETADTVLQLLATADSGTLPGSGTAAATGSPVALPEGSSEGTDARPPSTRGRRPAPTSPAKGKAKDSTDRTRASLPADRPEGTRAATFIEDVRHLSGAKALACGLTLAMDALTARTQPPLANAPQSQQQQQQQGQASASSAAINGTGAASLPVSTPPSARVNQRTPTMRSSGGPVGSHAGPSFESALEDDNAAPVATATEKVGEALAEAKSHLLMTFLEGLVASVLHTTTPQRAVGRAGARAGTRSIGTTARLPDGSDAGGIADGDEDTEHVVLQLLPRCSLDRTVVAFLRDLLAPAGDGAAVSFFHPGIHEWFARIVDFVEKKRLK